MFMFAAIAIFAATAEPVQAVEEIDNLEAVAESEETVILYEDADSEVVESQEIIFDNEVVDSESDALSEEN